MDLHPSKLRRYKLSLSSDILETGLLSHQDLQIPTKKVTFLINNNFDWKETITRPFVPV